MTGPGHIALINIFFAPNSFGGATIVAEEVAQELIVRHGRRVTAISAMHRTDLAPYTVMRVESRSVPNYLINLPRGRSYPEVYDNPRITDLVAGLLDRLQPDLVHAHCIQDIGVGILPMIRGKGLPLVLSMHDFWWICERQFMLRPDRTYCGQDPVDIEACKGCVPDLDQARTRFHALREAAANADVITFPSRFARDLSARSGISAPRLEVWENGVPGPGPGFFEAQAARRAADKRLVFGFLGGPSPVKGWPLIQATFETLPQDNFAGFLVEGSLDGRWWRDRNIGRLKGDWRVHPRFDRAGMDAFYAKIDVLLFPSQWKETFGLTVREALARGIHVVQTDSGGAAEWDGADPAAMLKIGDGPGELQGRVLKLLEDRPPPPAPRKVTSVADQAQAFLDLTAELV